MGSLGVKILHARKKSMIAELLKGRKMAIQLQTLLHKQPAADDGNLVSAEELSLQISRSFDNTLAELSSCAASTESAQIPAAVDCGQRRKNPVGTKNRRGCYKRRRTSDSWTVESSTTADGFAWRKYGQKPIMNSHYPRCYYRCTHRYLGCKATKQVQIVKEKPTLLYQTTYINHHSCSKTMRAYESRISLCPSDLLEPKNLISFHTKIDDLENPENPTTVVHPVKSEEHSDVQTSKVISEERSSNNTVVVQEDDLIGLEEEVDYGLEYFGMEVDDDNQFESLLLSFYDDPI